MMRDLTSKQIRFCDGIVLGLTGTDAAIKAGYKKSSAGVTASKMLTKANIKRYIETKMKKIVEKVEINQERVLREIGRIAFANPKALMNEDGTMKNIIDMDDDAAATISSIETEELFAGSGQLKIKTGEIKKVKMWSKTAALDQLGKHLGLFKEDNDQKKQDAAVVVPFTDKQTDKIINALRKNKTA